MSCLELGTTFPANSVSSKAFHVALEPTGAGDRTEPRGRVLSFDAAGRHSRGPSRGSPQARTELESFGEALGIRKRST